MKRKKMVLSPDAQVMMDQIEAIMKTIPVEGGGFVDGVEFVDEDAQVTEVYKFKKSKAKK